MNVLTRAGKEAVARGLRTFASSSSGSLPERKVAVLGAAGGLRVYNTILYMKVLKLYTIIRCRWNRSAFVSAHEVVSVRIRVGAV